MKSLMVGVMLASLVGSPAWAAKDSREKQMLRRVQQQVQQAEQARTQAEQEKADLQAEKEKLKQEYRQSQLDADTATRAAAAAKAENARLEKEVRNLRNTLADTRVRLEAVDKQLSDSKQLQMTTAKTLMEVDTAKKQTASNLQDESRRLQVCREQNGRLASLGLELIASYQQKSCKDAVLQREPFTGLKKVEMENLVEVWRDRLERDQVSNKVAR